MNKKEAILNELDSSSVQSWRKVMRCYREVFSYLESTLTNENCSYSKFEILLTLYLEEQKSPSQLADALTVTRGNISSFLQRLLKEELVEKVRPKPKSKRWDYRLSEKGNQLVERIAVGQAKTLKVIFNPLPVDSLDKLSASAVKARKLNVEKLHKPSSI